MYLLALILKAHLVTYLYFMFLHVPVHLDSTSYNRTQNPRQEVVPARAENILCVSDVVKIWFTRSDRIWLTSRCPISGQITTPVEKADESYPFPSQSPRTIDAKILYQFAYFACSYFNCCVFSDDGS